MGIIPELPKVLKKQPQQLTASANVGPQNPDQMMQSVAEHIRQALIPPTDDNQWKDLDTVQIIIKEVLVEEHLESLSQLNLDEIEAIENAITLNMLFQNPLITKKVITHLKLKRSYSEGKTSLMEHMFNMAKIVDQKLGTGLLDKYRRGAP